MLRRALPAQEDLSEDIRFLNLVGRALKRKVAAIKDVCSIHDI